MKKLWKIAKYVLIVLAAFFVLDLAVIIIMGQVRPKFEKVDAIIILGAAINTPALTNRSLEGLKIYQQGKASKIILSGGRISENDISEAGFMKKVISKNSSFNLPLIMEEASHSTYENLKFSKKAAPNVKSVVIVSDSFHLARAVLLAKRLGFKPVYWSAPNPSYYSYEELIYYYLRESVAMIAYFPKFIGIGL